MLPQHVVQPYSQSWLKIPGWAGEEHKIDLVNGGDAPAQNKRSNPIFGRFHNAFSSLSAMLSDLNWHPLDAVLRYAEPMLI